MPNKQLRHRKGALEKCLKDRELWLERMETAKQVIHHSRYIIYEFFFLFATVFTVGDYVLRKFR